MPSGGVRRVRDLTPRFVLIGVTRTRAGLAAVAVASWVAAGIVGAGVFGATPSPAQAGRHLDPTRSSQPKVGPSDSPALSSTRLPAQVGVPNPSSSPISTTTSTPSTESPAPVGRQTGFIASVDTMKLSRDTAEYPLPQSEIDQVVNQMASLDPDYITVDSDWEFPTYMQEWIQAIRAAGKHVWFRTQPNEWADSFGATGIMTPSQFEADEYSFITAHPSFFESGDIFDPLAEPENGLYWAATYGPNWEWQGEPNAATNAFNQFILQTTAVANQAFAADGISGVITNVRSVDSGTAENPLALYPATVAALGRITIDAYPEGMSTDPSVCAAAWLSVLATVHATRPGIPIIIGEMGYSNYEAVTDATQQAVLGAEFASMETVPYLAGVNYWVGPGYVGAGGYTYLLEEVGDTWSPRPAAATLAAFFHYESTS
jgi:hypothetical protein